MMNSVGFLSGIICERAFISPLEPFSLSGAIVFYSLARQTSNTLLNLLLIAHKTSTHSAAADGWNWKCLDSKWCTCFVSSLSLYAGAPRISLRHRAFIYMCGNLCAGTQKECGVCDCRFGTATVSVAAQPWCRTAWTLCPNRMAACTTARPIRRRTRTTRRRRPTRAEARRSPRQTWSSTTCRRRWRRRRSAPSSPPLAKSRAVNSSGTKSQVGHQHRF